MPLCVSLSARAASWGCMSCAFAHPRFACSWPCCAKCGLVIICRAGGAAIPRESLANPLPPSCSSSTSTSIHLLLLLRNHHHHHHYSSSCCCSPRPPQSRSNPAGAAISSPASVASPPPPAIAGRPLNAQPRTLRASRSSSSHSVHTYRALHVTLPLFYSVLSVQSLRLLPSHSVASDGHSSIVDP